MSVWLAPEILEGKAYSEKADLYSIGVILWELLTKQPFFGEVRFFSVLEDMVRCPLALCPSSCVTTPRRRAHMADVRHVLVRRNTGESRAASAHTRLLHPRLPPTDRGLLGSAPRYVPRCFILISIIY